MGNNSIARPAVIFGTALAREGSLPFACSFHRCIQVAEESPPWWWIQLAERGPVVGAGIPHYGLHRIGLAQSLPPVPLKRLFIPSYLPLF